jgi:hypothetical protein
VVVQGGGRSRAIERKNMEEKIITKYVGYNKRRVAEQKQVGGGGRRRLCLCMRRYADGNEEGNVQRPSNEVCRFCPDS